MNASTPTGTRSRLVGWEKPLAFSMAFGLFMLPGPLLFADTGPLRDAVLIAAACSGVVAGAIGFVVGYLSARVRLG